MAAVERLSDFSCTGYRRIGSVVEVDTNGPARVLVSFRGPGIVRIRVSPTGLFPPNPSPAVVDQAWPAAALTVADRPDMLILRSGQLSLHIDKRHLRLDLYAADDRTLLRAEAPADGTTWDDTTGAISHTQALTDGERLYGLGQDNSNGGVLDRRGTVREMWTGQQIRSGNVTADYPVPFYLSTGIGGHGYGCFVDNVWHLRFDLGKSQSDRLTWTAPGGPIDYYLIDGPSFKTVIDRYTQLTGRPSMLPLWAFGYWQSKCVYWNFEDMLRAESRFQADGIPLDVLVIDNSWVGILMDYRWNERWKDPDQQIAGFHSRGHRIILYSSPMVRKDAVNYASAQTAGVLATDGDGHPVTCGYYDGDLLDITHPSFDAWLWPQLAKRRQEGVDGWFIDLIEPEGEPPQTVYYAGKSADIHNTYPLRTFRSFYDFQKSATPDSRPVLLGRAAGAGTQRYGSILWTGDTHSDWPTFRAHIPEAQNAGLSGLPWWTNDCGGFLSGFYKNDRYGAHARLYERWMEFTCFAPIARAHKAGPAEPFEYGPAVEATARKYLKLRYRLMPYLYTYAYAAHATGVPLLRPLVLEYQNDAAAGEAKDEYLFGPDLLVAPVLNEDVAARSVYLPAGRWIGLEDGCEYPGGGTVVVAAPQDRIPLFVRAGAILPMAPDMLHTGEKPWDPITLDVYPDGSSSASLYEDDGLTTAFERGAQTTTAFRCSESPRRSVTLTLLASNKQFAPKQWIARFHLTSGPASVTVDGRPLSRSEWQVDPASNVLTVPFPDAARLRHRVDVTLDGADRPRPAPPSVALPALDASGAPAPVTETVHVFPPPQLPGRVAAVNFDDGGEGLAYHFGMPRSATAVHYRSEPVGIIAADDVGGGYALTGLAAGDWLNYTVDAGAGGWFEAAVRVAPHAPNGGGLTLLRNRHEPIAAFDVNGAGTKAPAGGAWSNIASTAPFYLNPGETVLTLEVMHPGFDLSRIEFVRPAQAPATVEAEDGRLSGRCGVDSNHGGFRGSGFVTGLGLRGALLSVVLTAEAAGQRTLSLRYANGGAVPVVLTVRAEGDPVEVSLPPTGDWDHWAAATVTVPMAAGPNSVALSGSGRDTINLDSVSMIDDPPGTR
jgi:alpha-glucosidase (family GH31 glycosyl hydrolase)